MFTQSHVARNASILTLGSPSLHKTARTEQVKRLCARATGKDSDKDDQKASSDPGPQYRCARLKIPRRQRRAALSAY